MNSQFHLEAELQFVSINHPSANYCTLGCISSSGFGSSQDILLSFGYLQHISPLLGLEYSDYIITWLPNSIISKQLTACNCLSWIFNVIKRKCNSSLEYWQINLSRLSISFILVAINAFYLVEHVEGLLEKIRKVSEHKVLP